MLSSSEGVVVGVRWRGRKGKKGKGKGHGAWSCARTPLLSLGRASHKFLGMISGTTFRAAFASLKIAVRGLSINVNLTLRSSKSHQFSAAQDTMKSYCYEDGSCHHLNCLRRVRVCSQEAQDFQDFQARSS